jgi:16S rRNA (guanine527-N7)-methyltransferase
MKLDSDKWKNIVVEGISAIDVDIDGKKTDLLSRYAIELLDWNQKINLTAIKDPEEIAEKHFIDSAIPLKFIPSGSRLLDIGSGGGFPGIVLKVINPSISVTLIDASLKKINFLKHIIRTLSLENVQALHLRGEDLEGKSDFSNSFDVITSRAFSSLDKFITMAFPLLSEKGMILAMKGKNISGEIKALNSLSLKLHDKSVNCSDYFDMKVKEYTLPYSDAKRSIIILTI